MPQAPSSSCVSSVLINLVSRGSCGVPKIANREGRCSQSDATYTFVCRLSLELASVLVQTKDGGSARESTAWSIPVLIIDVRLSSSVHEGSL